MKIDPQNNPLSGLQAAVRTPPPHVKAEKNQVSASEVATQTLEQPVRSDIDRHRDAVARLRATPDIRPEVVAARKASDPAKIPTDAQLMQFISALKDEA